MKKVILILLLFTIVSHAQWLQVSNGMGIRKILSLASRDSVLFAGTRYFGVYSSTNNGADWTHCLLNVQSVPSLVFNGGKIFAAAAYNYGLYYSNDNGINWAPTSLSSEQVWTLAVGSNIIYAGTEINGVYRSTDNGVSWSQTSLNDRSVYSLAVNGNTIFAITYPNVLFLSSNDGANWSQTSLNNVYSLAVGGNYVFAGTSSNGVYKSTNNGAIWLQTLLNNQKVYSLKINGNTIFAGTDVNGVYVSNDNGANWTHRSEGLDSLSVSSFCTSNNYIFAGTFENSVYRRQLNELTAIQIITGETPRGYFLSQNYPNPFNPTTNFEFRIAEFGFVNIRIFDLTGREVETLVNDNLSAGAYKIDWNASNYSSGVYFYRLEAEGFSETKKMLLVK